MLRCPPTARPTRTNYRETGRAGHGRGAVRRCACGQPRPGRARRWRPRASRTSAPCRSPSSGTRRRSARSAGSCSARSCPWQNSRTSLGGQRAAPGRSLTQAMSSSPYFASGTPITCTSAIVRVGVEELLDLARVDVLAAADDHVLDPADDVARSRPRPSPRGRRCASSAPASIASAVLLRRRPSSRASPSSRGCTARRARRAAATRPVVRVDDLDLDVRVDPADGRRPAAPASSSARVWRGHRRRLGHAVADRHLGHVHLADAPASSPRPGTASRP